VLPAGLKVPATNRFDIQRPIPPRQGRHICANGFTPIMVQRTTAFAVAKFLPDIGAYDLFNP
jgi:hypothetical protein